MDVDSTRTCGNASDPYLSCAVQLVREFHFAEGDRFFHPVGAEVGRVGVHVDRRSAGGLSLASRHPVTVHVLPALLVHGPEVDQHRVHGARIQAG